MKQTKSGKLGLKRITIATLSGDQLRGVGGGLPRSDSGATASVCGGQCCDTDHYTNCASRPGICW
jgi:hypothetical protein